MTFQSFQGPWKEGAQPPSQYAWRPACRTDLVGWWSDHGESWWIMVTSSGDAIWCNLGRLSHGRRQSLDHPGRDPQLWPRTLPLWARICRQSFVTTREGDAGETNPILPEPGRDMDSDRCDPQCCYMCHQLFSNAACCSYAKNLANKGLTEEVQ